METFIGVSKKYGHVGQAPSCGLGPWAAPVEQVVVNEWLKRNKNYLKLKIIVKKTNFLIFLFFPNLFDVVKSTISYFLNTY